MIEIEPLTARSVPIHFEDEEGTFHLPVRITDGRMLTTYQFQGGTASLGGDVQANIARQRYVLNCSCSMKATKSQIVVRPVNASDFTNTRPT